MSNYYVHSIVSFTDLLSNFELLHSDESLEDILELLHVLRVLVDQVQMYVCNYIAEGGI